MPAFIKNPEDERLWDKAKDIAAKEGHKEEWNYITGIYKKMKGGKVALELDIKRKAIKAALTEDQKNQAIQLLKSKPIPIPDKPIHDLADKLKVQTDDLESYIYGLAQGALISKIPSLGRAAKRRAVHEALQQV